MLRLGKVSKADYYDIMSEFVMQKILRPDSCCVDVGCHRGDVLDPMLRFAPKGKFFAFEPLPTLFEGLKTRFGTDERVKLFNLALSEQDGVVSFQHVVSAPAYSGFRGTEAARGQGAAETISVKTARLDDILRGMAVDFVKIDVEGAELQVLRGGLETLKRCRPYVLFEHEKHAAQYDTGPDDLFDLLYGECRLNISVLDEYLRGGKSLSKTEFLQRTKSESNFLAHRQES